MAKLWQKADTQLNPIVEKYTVATDPVFDLEFLPFDIQAAHAHAKGLKKIGLLSAAELKKLSNGLNALLADVGAGKVTIAVEDEDCYTLIENYLVRHCGDVGKKINTGRSRNEVVTMVRLYMMHHLAALSEQCVELSDSFIGYAEKYTNVPMVGYSHTQQAMLSSVGHYMAAFGESILDDAEYARMTKGHIGKSPAGSAAGFGTVVAIDRTFIAKELGFGDVQQNSLYCHNSRGKFESAYMEVLAQTMLTLGKFANDMVFFTSQEFDYFAVADSLVTGSSIMPHKRNLDAMEMVRSNTSVVLGNQLIVKDVAKNLLSGYNRDGQLMKKPLVESTKIALESIEVVSVLLKGLTPKAENMKQKIHSGIFTADIANELAKKGMPFRDAYVQSLAVPIGEVDLAKNIASKKSLGAPGNLNLAACRKRIQKMRRS